MRNSLPAPSFPSRKNQSQIFSQNNTDGADANQCVKNTSRNSSFILLLRPFPKRRLPKFHRGQGEQNQLFTTTIPPMPRTLALGLLLFVSAYFLAQTPVTPVCCAPPDVNPPAPSAGKALIFVYRVGHRNRWPFSNSTLFSSAVGFAQYDRIYTNGDFLASLHNSNYAQREVQPGQVSFRAISKIKYMPGVTIVQSSEAETEPPELLRIQVKARNTYYVKWSATMMPPYSKLTLVNAAKGTKEMHGLRPAEDKKD